MSRFLITSDLHLSQDARHEYRWQIFDWLAKQAQRRKVDKIFILGDVTDLKDHHANRLINRLVRSLFELAQNADADVHILRGNHDAHDPKSPLLGFVQDNRVVFYRDAGVTDDVVLVAHHRDPFHFMESFNRVYEPQCRFLMMHQTFDGVYSETGHQLESSFRTRILCKAGNVEHFISGDIHAPQCIGPVVYCGSPHPVRFGDSYSPRVLFWDGQELRSINRTTIRKLDLSIEDPEELEHFEFFDGDQAKVRLTLSRADFGSWHRMRTRIAKIMKGRGVYLHTIELVERKSTKRVPLRGAPPRRVAGMLEVFRSYCSQNKIDERLRTLGEGFVQ